MTQSEQLAKLRESLADAFNNEELETLSFDLGVRYDDLSGQGVSGKARELTSLLERTGRIADLVARCRVLRPNLSWEDVTQTAGSKPPPGLAPSPDIRESTSPASATTAEVAVPQYLDFEVEIGNGSGRDYPVSVMRSPAGEAQETMRFPYDDLALDNRLKSMQIALLHSGGVRRQVLSTEEQAVREFGRELFNALFAGEARSRYDVSWGVARQQGVGLRLKLRIKPPELAQLPWEFLFDPRQAEYVCLSRDTPVVRYLDLPQTIQPLAVTAPLRILGMAVSPHDLDSLDVAREKQRTEAAIGDLQAQGLVSLTWLEGHTWRDLQRAMRGGPWHIFHFVGHGGFDRIADEGFIVLADEMGAARPFRATELGRLLSDHHSLRLVLLNSCEGAHTSDNDIFSSSAAILVRRGMPAVLAMQYGISDRAAVEFSRAFYEALADGLPVDAAVSEARKSVSLATNGSVEWGTPVLYMRAPQGVIFQMTEMKHIKRALPSLPPQVDKELERRLEQLYTDGLSAFWIEDWTKASQIFRTLIDLQPNYSDARAKLDAAERQSLLGALYTQARASLQAEQWVEALSTLERLVSEAPDFKDVTTLLESAKKKKQLSDLTGEARRLFQAQQWQAVVNVFAQIAGLEPDFGDPEGLHTKATQELTVLKRQTELSDLYSRAVREIDTGHWQAAGTLLNQVQEMEVGFRETPRLLARVDAEINREKEERQRLERIAVLYEQANGLARSRQWRHAQQKMQEILALDAKFHDAQGIAANAQDAIALEESEAKRQNELAILYSEAVKLLHAQQYQAALAKWGEVQMRDARFPDRQRVHSTAIRKLDELARASKPQRKSWPWLVGVLGILGILAIVVMTLIVQKSQEYGLSSIGMTSTVVNTSKRGVIETGFPIPTALPAVNSTITPTPQPAASKTPWATVTPIASITPQATVTLIASETPRPTDLPMVTPSPKLAPTTIPKPRIFDDFNNAAFDGSFNHGLWGASTGKDSMFQQQGGSLVITLKAPDNDLSLWPTTWPESDVKTHFFFETKVKIVSGGSAVPFLNVIIKPTYGFGLSLVGTSAPCSAIKTLGQSTVSAGDWHVLRMDLDPTTRALTCFVDGKVIYSGVPADAPPTEYVFINLRMVTNNSNDTNNQVAAFDDVRIQPVSK